MQVGDAHIAVHLEDEQRSKMKSASTAMVTEARREILWLKGFGIFWVFGVFALVEQLTDSFPASIILATATFTFIKRCIDTKPNDYLKHHFTYLLILPKHWTHRPDNTARFDRIVKLRGEMVKA